MCDWSFIQYELKTLASTYPNAALQIYTLPEVQHLGSDILGEIQACNDSLEAMCDAASFEFIDLRNIPYEFVNPQEHYTALASRVFAARLAKRATAFLKKGKRVPPPLRPQYKSERNGYRHRDPPTLHQEQHPPSMNQPQRRRTYRRRPWMTKTRGPRTRQYGWGHRQRQWSPSHLIGTAYTHGYLQRPHPSYPHDQDPYAREQPRLTPPEKLPIPQDQEYHAYAQEAQQMEIPHTSGRKGTSGQTCTYLDVLYKSAWPPINHLTPEYTDQPPQANQQWSRNNQQRMTTQPHQTEGGTIAWNEYRDQSLRPPPFPQLPYPTPV
ncbi:uncharacterized protein LOC135392928 [Ornithodoros turicata]|uniref:uncharacterized protein LOC135392928 n=1 Tax=Ornithodoros turicata TaxID=34597 RepID=UPI003139C6D7